MEIDCAPTTLLLKIPYKKAGAVTRSRYIDVYTPAFPIHGSSILHAGRQVILKEITHFNTK